MDYLSVNIDFIFPKHHMACNNRITLHHNLSPKSHMTEKNGRYNYIFFLLYILARHHQSFAADGVPKTTDAPISGPDCGPDCVP